MTYKTRFQYLLDKATDIAQPLRLLNPVSARLPALFFLTDPVRTPHPEDIAEHLPEGCGIIYRHFDEAHAAQRARLLRRIASQRSLMLLIGDDEALAVETGADGLHLPERRFQEIPAMAERHPNLVLTVACHDAEGLKRREISVVSAVFVSPVFASRSASATGKPALGVKGVKDLVAASPVPVYGLGGINCDTIADLRDTGLSGIGAIDAFSLKD